MRCVEGREEERGRVVVRGEDGDGDLAAVEGEEVGERDLFAVREIVGRGGGDSRGDWLGQTKGDKAKCQLDVVSDAVVCMQVDPVGTTSLCRERPLWLIDSEREGGSGSR